MELRGKPEICHSNSGKPTIPILNSVNAMGFELVSRSGGQVHCRMEGRLPLALTILSANVNQHTPLQYSPLQHSPLQHTPSRT